MSEPSPGGGTWTLLTGHGHVLVEIARNPEARIRDISPVVGLTVRFVQAIVADLEAAGYLTRTRIGRRVVYAVISTDRAQALSTRAVARRLGVVPGALYRHVRRKEQLYDLILDAVLAEVDCRTDPALRWTAPVAACRQPSAHPEPAANPDHIAGGHRAARGSTPAR